MRIRLAVLACLAIVLTGCGERGDHPASPEPDVVPGAWERLPDPPLAARGGPVVAWTGTELLVVGGDTSEPCPPNADCVLPPHYAPDGAAYDPATRTWREIQDSPAGIEAFSQSALIGGTLFVLSARTLLAYDVDHDSWRELSTPPMPGSYQLVQDGDRMVFVSGSDENGVHPDRAYDPASGRWSQLSEDPIGPAYDRLMTATPHGLVLTAKELVDNPGGGDRPSLVVAAVLGKEGWRRLPDSDQIGGWRAVWTGQHVVDPTLGGSNGGGEEPGDYGRTIPNGGRLDPVTGRWSRLPHAPEELTGGWPVEALAGPVVAAEGWLFDDRDETWRRVPRPESGPTEPGRATWAGDRLAVVGGMRYTRGESDTQERSPHVWMSQPAPILGANAS